MDCYSCNNSCKNPMQGKDIPPFPTSTDGHPTEGSTNGHPSVPSSITLGTAPAPISHGNSGNKGSL